MGKTIINNKQVKEIRQDGIVYFDKVGNEQFIDFEECCQNFLRRHLTPEAIEGYKRLNHKTDDEVEDYIVSVKKWRYVADRNVTEYDFVDGISTRGLPYFEFHTRPPVRIEFESQDDLREMQYKIEREFRWRTFDVT